MSIGNNGRIYLRRIATLFLIPAIAMVTVVGLTASPALAGEDGRNCETYYYHADPSFGWGFTVCVKVVHNPTTHQWQTVGSVTTTTPGMVLHTATAAIDIANPDGSPHILICTTPETTDPSCQKGPAATQILGIVSGVPQFCQGSVLITAWIDEQVHWPDGELSSPTETNIRGTDGVSQVFPKHPVVATC